MPVRIPSPTHETYLILRLLLVVSYERIFSCCLVFCTQIVENRVLNERPLPNN